MGLAYGVRLRVTDQVGAPAATETIAHVVGRWAQIDQPMAAAQQSGRKSSTVVTEVFGSPEATHAWRLRLSHADQQDDAVRWQVTVAVVRGDTTDVSVRLGRTRLGSTVLPLASDPAPPGCIGDLLDEPSLVFPDALRPVLNRPWVVGADDANQLANLVLSPERRLPVFALTLRDDDAVDGGWLLPRVVGLAHVVVVKSQASWRLDRLLPRGLNVYGGAARLWWPGITASSSRWEHPLWTADVPSHRIQHEARAKILEAGLAVSFFDRRLTDLERQERRIDEDEQLAKLGKLRTLHQEQAEQDGQADGTASAALSRDTDARLADAESLITRLQEDRDDALELAAATERELDESKERAGRAEQETDLLRAEIERLRTIAGEQADMDPSDVAVLREIEAELAGRGEVEGAQPCDYALGGSFSATLDLVGYKYRTKVIKACADIILRSPGLLRRREDHALRTGGGGDDPQRSRATDGATARRCYIEHGTPAARRLHYWLLPDQSIELASVNLHDDLTIPE